MSRIKRRIWFVVIAVCIGGLVLADSLGVFDTKPYKAVPHGNHNHYVPHDRDPDVSISDFPTHPPRDGEKITPAGQVVPDTEKEQR